MNKKNDFRKAVKLFIKLYNKKKGIASLVGAASFVKKHHKQLRKLSRLIRELSNGNIYAFINQLTDSPKPISIFPVGGKIDELTKKSKEFTQKQLEKFSRLIQTSY